MIAPDWDLPLGLTQLQGTGGNHAGPLTLMLNF
jgi:hypothetical protein